MEKENIAIRYAKQKELEQVNKLRKEVHELHCSGRADIFNSDSWNNIEEFINVRFSSDESGVIVAVKGDEIVGFATVQYIHKAESAFQQARSFYHIEEFGVDKEHRRRGIATRLMDFMRNDAVGRGFEKIELDMWEFNEGALRFYENIGFLTYRRHMELMI